MEYKKTEKISKRKYLEGQANGVYGSFNRHTGNSIEVMAQEYYKQKNLFIRQIMDIFPLTDDHTGKFQRLYTLGMNKKTNRIDDHYLDNMFKTYDAMYKYRKVLLQHGMIKKIDGYYYVNPNLINCWGTIKVGSEQDKLIKAFTKN